MKLYGRGECENVMAVKRETALRYGAHLSLADMKYTAGIIEKCGCGALQIFSDGARSNLEKLISVYDLEISAHMPYVVNLASGDESLREKSVEHVIAALDESSRLKIKNYVVHPGSGTYDRLEESIDEIIKNTRGLYSRLLIENTEGSGNKLFAAEDEIAGFIGKYHGNIGICWDTAHAFGAGVDTLSLSADVLKHIKLVHLNDSKMPFGSKKDRHAGYSEGLIGLKAIEKMIEKMGSTPAYIIEREGYENICSDLLFLNGIRL